MRSLKNFAVLSLFLSINVFLAAQTGTSTVRGTVTDPSGGVISGATVTLTNTQTNAVRTVTSGDTGNYVFDLITPSTYRVTAEATGFKKKVLENVQALIGKPTTADIALEVGAANEVVEVRSSDQEALVNTQDASLGNNFNSLQITQLPLEARNVVDLLSLQPGSTREGYVTGARADQSNITLDGVDINNAQSGNAEIPRTTNSLVVGALDSDRGDITSGPVLRLSAEAVEEFRVTTANGNANQGRSSGAQINIVTKQGTNAWHGAASEFYRSRGFTANDWFNNHATPVVERPSLVRNTFEGGIGGPLVKNKVFFFYDYAGRRDASSQSVSRIVPLATLGAGTINYQYCADAACNTVLPNHLDLTDTSQIWPVGLNPLAMQALADAAATFPNNDLTNGDQLNTGGFRFNAPTPVRLNAHTGRLDFNLSQRQSVFARLQIQDDHQSLPQWLPDSVSPVVWAHNWGLAVGHTWTISNNWVNNLRYGLTRQSFTNSGDSFGDDTEFRFVFQPNGQQHPLSQVVPVHNLTDDLSWIHGNHTIQFGGNIRFVSNKRIDYFPTGDFAEMNPSYYGSAGFNVYNDFQTYLDTFGLPGDEGVGQSLASTREVRDAGTAIIGRYSQLQSFFNFAHDGSLQAHNVPSARDFASQSYDEYVQDTWKVRPSLTLTLGLRYSLERPVYEKNGFEVQPTIPLGQYLTDRTNAGNQGSNFVDLITLDKSGAGNGRKPMYNWDKNNFQPRIAAAWTPDNGKTSFRGGFAMTNDYFGQALAVDFDLNSSIGYVENFLNHANSFDVTGSSSRPPGPLFTGFGQPVSPLVNATFPGVIPSSLVLPNALPSLNGSVIGERIEQSLDSALHAPTQYTWNFTIERQTPKGGVFSASYIGRAGRHLLARRDVAQFNNLKDPATGVDWYTAATALEKLRQKSGTDAAINQVPNLPANIQKYFDDMFPAGMAQLLQDFDYGDLPTACNSAHTTDGGWDCNWSNAQAFMAYSGSAVDFYTANDWTDVQADVDNALAFTADPVNGDPKAMRFMQPQFGSLSTWSSIGNSNYHALTLSFRQRLKTLILDFNYTFAHSLDDASGLQSESGYGNNSGSNGAFIVNSLRQRENYASSDFDVKHSINADFVWQVPIGRGQAFLGNVGKGADALLGGWQLSSIIRWNTGLPTGVSPFDESQWATSWNVQSNTTPTSSVHSCPNKPKSAAPKIFGGCDVTAIYQSMRNAYPGESGPRNYLRYPGYFDLDLGLSKSFKMPWEGHQLTLRWDVFNVTNTQSLTGIVDFSVVADPGLTQQTPPADWGNLFQVQGQPRVMQIGARYSF
jgi:hypothetical protein